MRLIDADAFGNRLYHEVFEKDSEDQRWDSGCWMRYRLFEKVLREQPTVEQPEQQWIPCSERLPKINQIVLLSTNSNNVYVGYRNKPELLWQVEEDGRKQWVYDPESYDVDIDVLPKTEDIDFYCEGVNDGGFLSITSANYNDRFEGVTAWMSLPEPYKGDEQG